jgi:hypothetical protein
MAGLGARLFPAFSKLTSAQVNGYLMDQTIMRFANAAARDAAFGGAGEPTLAEGMTCYLDDTNEIQSYNGTAWVSVAASSTVRDVSSGLVYIDGGTQSGSTGLNVDGVFTSSYTNYRLVMTAIETSEANRAVRINFRSSGTTNVDALYDYAYRGLRSNGVTADTSFAGTFAEIGVYIASYANLELGSASIDINGPQISKRTFGLANAIGYEGGVFQMRNGGFVFNGTNSFDGFRISLSSTGNVAFQWQLYGYRK